MFVFFKKKMICEIDSKEVELQLIIYLISLYHLEKIIKIQDKLM